MNRPPFPAPLRGIIPPLATPLKGRDELDVAGLERLIEHVLAGGVHGLFLLGTTGEGPSLSNRLRRELIDRACRQVAGRVPVLVGVTDTSFTESVRLTAHAAEAGANAVVLAPPFYFSASQAELADYVEHIAPELALPVLLYHIPSHAKLGFDPETVARLIHIPNVVGLKDSGGKMIYLHELRLAVAARPDFTLLVGPEELMAEAVLLGAHGGICGGANMVPRLYVDLYAAASAGDLHRVRELHDRVMRISVAIYNVGGAGSSYMRGLKCALACLGLCDDTLAEPLQRFGPAERERIRMGLCEVGLLDPAT